MTSVSKTTTAKLSAELRRNGARVCWGDVGGGTTRGGGGLLDMGGIDKFILSHLGHHGISAD